MGKKNYINHTTLSTGHTRRSMRADVHDDVLARVVMWLSTALAAGVAVPLPAPLSTYSARATHEGGALLCTVLAPANVPLAVFAVVLRSRATVDAWAMLVAQFSVAEGLKCPTPPWCAVSVFAGVLKHPDALTWLADFEQCVAWAWAER